MKKKLSIFAFGLLLAVGWTNSASAQKLADSTPWYSSHFFTKMIQPTMNNDQTANPVEIKQEAIKSTDGNMPKAPQRANYTQTAPATHVKSWYDAKHYTWYDENDNEQTASYTDVVTDPHQMFWFTRSLYTDYTMPGIKYSEAQGWDIAYDGCDFGYWISGDVTQDIRIYMTGRLYVTEIVVYDYAGNVITSYDVNSGTTPPTGWTMPNRNSMTRDYETVSTSQGNERWYYWRMSSNYADFTEAFVISKDLLAGHGGVYVDVLARQSYSNTATRYYSFYINRYDYNRGQYAGQSTSEVHSVTNSWAWYETMAHGPITPPTENGYSIVLVKLTNDFDYETGQAEMFTDTDSALYAYFDKYVDELVLLTDGMRVEEGEVDAGTVFTYSGLLNRFYFIGKGKTYQICGSENAWYTPSGSSQYNRYADRAPFYSMYEEFSPATQDNQTGIDDFYSRMLEGESYGVIHDCQSVNYMEHFFSMTGKGGTENKSLTNLIFYIPDNRGQSDSRDYETEHAPQVGLYNITLTAKAVPVPDYSPSNRYYNVTNDWVSSLSQILDFDLDQDYELWIWIYDAQGNPVAKEKVEGTDIFHNTLTYTYQVPQYPESYTIVYRVKGWPKDATNNPVNDPDGTFYTWSNLAEVLIPGYENFLSLKLNHYESDFKIDEEHNYYRNFMTVDNQNPDNALTANRILAGEDLFKLYRFADGDKNSKVKAAELSFFQEGDDIWYNIDYFGQNILDGYDLQTLNIPTRGPVATIGGGKFVKVTSASDLTSGQYLIVYETDGVAFDGSLVGTDLDKGHNEIPVNIEDGVIMANTDVMGSAFTIDMTAGTVKSASGYYIGYGATTSNGMNTSATNAYTNTISLSGSDAIIQGTGGRQLRFNSSSGTDNYRFRYYSSTSQKAIQLYKLVENRDGQTRSFSMLNNDLDVANYTQGYIYPTAPWSVSGTNLSLQSNGYFYILSGNGLNFTMPTGFNGANLKFVVHVGTSGYYRGTFDFTAPSGNFSVPTTATNTDYEVIIPNVNSGDVINIKGTCIYNDQTYQYSPDFSTLYVYVQGGQGGVSGDDPLYLAGIMFVDQFNALTKNDTHPYRYGYFLQYDPEDPEEEPATSSVQEVPVQHTGATLDGYYTLQEIQDDEYATLDMNVMNAQVNMNLANNPAIYFYTLDRKPSNDPDAVWDEISQLQIRTDGTYQEIDEKLTQYIEQVCEPGIVPRYDNETYSVLYGNHNDYMSYAPIVWTHGDLSNNKRIKWESEKRHNSYGAPIWKTGVGDAKIISADSWRQQGKYGSTNWVDENNDSCSLYFLEVTAQGFLPTNNTVTNENGYVPYVPYWFNVYATSASGKLRGYTQVGTPGTDPDNTGSAGSHLVNNPEKNRYVWRVYGGRTTDGYLEKHLSNTWADNFAFGALNNISDLQIVVRFYYVVNGMIQSTDYVMDRDGAPAGYGAESPGKSPEPHTGIIEVLNPNHGNLVKTTYVNPQGLQSDKPFDGVNIVINRYEDGTTSTSKVIR